MLTALFIIAFIWFMWKVIALAVKMTWGFLKIGFYIIFLPILIIGGIIALVISK